MLAPPVQKQCRNADKKRLVEIRIAHCPVRERPATRNLLVKSAECSSALSIATRSGHYGRWVPARRFSRSPGRRPLRPTGCGERRACSSAHSFLQGRFPHPGRKRGSSLMKISGNAVRKSKGVTISVFLRRLVHHADPDRSSSSAQYVDAPSLASSRTLSCRQARGGCSQHLHRSEALASSTAS